MIVSIRRSLALASFVVAIATFAPTTALAASPPHLRVGAAVSCLPRGGLGIELTLENRGSRTAHIDPDIHLLIEPVRVGGRQPGIVLFVFPAPDFARIPPGESRTFLVTAGEPFDGEPAIDFSGARVLLELEVWLRHRKHPLTRTMSFPACP
jgi:hypothetical protein